MAITIISEIGINHNGDFRKIEELIRQSKTGGADYAKFQLYDSIRVFGDESRKQNEFTFQQVERVKKICDHYQIEFFASVFDEENADMLERIGTPAYKIASCDITHLPLLKHIAKKGKPIIYTFFFRTYKLRIFFFFIIFSPIRLDCLHLPFLV